MKISAVIPTKDRPSDLVRAVESVLRQKRCPDELLIIDQSRSDESRVRVLSLLTEDDQRLKLIYVHDPSIPGLVAAKDAAVKKSSSDVVMFLEDDVVIEEDYVANLAQGFVDHPGMMGACGIVSQVAGTGSLYRWIFHLFHRGIFYDKRVDVHGHTDKNTHQLIQSNYLSGGVSAYRREVFERVKFDTQNGFFMLEDIDFSTRAVKEFGPEHFFINTSARLAHLMSPANRARLAGRYQRKLREFVCFYKKNCDQSGALVSLLWLLVGLTLEAVVVSIKARHFGPISGSIRGLMEGIKWQIRQV